MNKWQNEIQPNLIIALDNLSSERAKEVITEISSDCLKHIDRIIFKVNDLLAFEWLKWISSFHEWKDGSIMLDPKYHDISNTLVNYIEKVNEADLWKKAKYLTIHASNWYDAIKKAIEKREELWMETKILAVTALTSLNDEQTSVIYGENSENTVLKLAKESLDAWVDGIVCSPKEAALLRKNFKDYNFEIVTPWVRFEWESKWDQQRVTTPKGAIEWGSSHIVMWRSIIKASDVKGAIWRFFDEVDSILK